MGDSVDHDVRILGERNWRNLALNREEWRKLLKKGRAVEPKKKMMMMMMSMMILHIRVI
jgi:hypothetical protein